MKGKALIRKATTGLIDALYPPRCLACPEPTETAMGLCGSCWREVHFFAGDVCDLCGVPVPGAESDARIICESCSHYPPPWDKGRAAVEYDGVGRRIVLALKHGDRLDMTATLARWMTGAAGAVADPDMLVVPVPLHWQRLVLRRFNQSAELARAVARRIGATYAPEALQRVRPTPIQQGMNRAERQQNVADAIAVSAKHRAGIAGRDILLIDDVLTTGATLSAASAALRDAGATRIHVLTLARVARPE